jgi:hypothetical protein
MSQAYHTLQVEYERLVAERQAQGPGILDDPAFADASGLFASTDLPGSAAHDGTLSGYDFLDAVPSSDMLAGLYLQHDRSTYPSI